MAPLEIDLERAAARINDDVQSLAIPPYSDFADRVCRYAYTDPFRNTREYFASAWRELGFIVQDDPVGNFVARNRPAGSAVFGVGSHFDSNRNGGRWDGALGMAVALEVSRLNVELALELPLQAIAFLEEEASGFGQLLLGSRIVSGLVDESNLRDGIRSLDDGRSFWEHAVEAGYRPDLWRDCARILDDLTGWIEVHIEQGRILQDGGHPIGVVHAIAGYVHGDITIDGRADHAGATPMPDRLDSGVAAAMTIVELERLARTGAGGIVATVGEIEVAPGAINVVPGRTRFSLDIRGPDGAAIGELLEQATSFARITAGDRGMRASYAQRQRVDPVQMDPSLVAALERNTRACGHEPVRMISGAAHDTMLVAQRAPSAMIFVPCRDGLSHTPLEDANPHDAALAAQVILTTLRESLS
jgi:hydantoinase/carbamoylase family amidase